MELNFKHRSVSASLSHPDSAYTNISRFLKVHKIGNEYIKTSIYIQVISLHSLAGSSWHFSSGQCVLSSSDTSWQTFPPAPGPTDHSDWTSSNCCTTRHRETWQHSCNRHCCHFLRPLLWKACRYDTLDCPLKKKYFSWIAIMIFHDIFVGCSPKYP